MRQSQSSNSVCVCVCGVCRGVCVVWRVCGVACVCACVRGVCECVVCGVCGVWCLWCVCVRARARGVCVCVCVCVCVWCVCVLCACTWEVLLAAGLTELLQLGLLAELILLKVLVPVRDLCPQISHLIAGVHLDGHLHTHTERFIKPGLSRHQ